MRALLHHVRQFPGAIGYVELIYALAESHQLRLRAERRTATGVKASIDGVTLAGGHAKIPADYRVSITNAPGPNAYPISSFTYLLIPTQPKDMAKEKVIKDMLSWIITSGESEVFGLSYAPLPQDLAPKSSKTVYSLP